MFLKVIIYFLSRKSDHILFLKKLILICFPYSHLKFISSLRLFLSAYIYIISSKKRDSSHSSVILLFNNILLDNFILKSIIGLEVSNYYLNYIYKILK